MNRFLWLARLRIGAMICSRRGHDFDLFTIEGPMIYEETGGTSVATHRMCSRCEYFERVKQVTQ